LKLFPDKPFGFLFFYLTILPIFSTSRFEDPLPADVFQSLVQIKTVKKNKDHIFQRSGVGVVIKKKRVLTNLHIVRDSDEILVRGVGEEKFVTAKIEFSGYDCDLAILGTESGDFLKRKKEVNITSSPLRSGEIVTVTGIEDGSVKNYNGKILDIRFDSYGHSGIDFHKIIEADFKIKEGVSGSPAFAGKNFAGIAFQTSSTKSRIIHKDVVMHFLNDIEDGVYDGFAEIGFRFQKSAPPELKKYFRVPEETPGVFITSILRTSGFEKSLRPKDFLYAIDDIQIDQEGLFGPNSEILDRFEKKSPGDCMKLSYFRDGKSVEVNHRLKKIPLIDFYRDHSLPTANCQGLMFRVMGKGAIDFSREDFESSLAYHYFYLAQDDLGNSSNSANFILIGASPDVQKNIHTGYENEIVESVNSTSPENFQNFEKICKNPKDEFIRIKFRGVNLPLILKNNRYKKR